MTPRKPRKVIRKPRRLRVSPNMSATIGLQHIIVGPHPIMPDEALEYVEGEISFED